MEDLYTISILYIIVLKKNLFMGTSFLLDSVTKTSNTWGDSFKYDMYILITFKLLLHSLDISNFNVYWRVLTAN